MKTIFSPEIVPQGTNSASAATTERAVKQATAPEKPSSGRIEPVSERYPALEKQEVLLSFVAPEAKKVEVGGTFNGWRPEFTPLLPVGEGEWTVRLMLPSGQYEYRFAVDGHWVDDPDAEQRVINPFGGYNSVVTVALDVTSELL
jgi:1,4-alpha-glucan branching enzyme